jgi:hypothetical protein
MELTKAEFIRILDERLEIKLEQKLEQKLNEKLDQKFAIHTAEIKTYVVTFVTSYVDKKIGELALMIKQGFDNVDIQFSQVNRRLDALEGKSFNHGWVPRYK